MRKYRKNYSSLTALPKTLNNFSTITSVGIFAVIGLLVYKVYKFVMPSSLERAENAAEKQANENYTTRPASEAVGLKSLEDQLKARGLVVSTMHISQANTLHQYMDRVWVTDSQITNLIKSMSLQTFQLVFIAYKQRELANYRNSHLLDGDSWLDMFSDKKLYGTLKYHLQVVLSSSSLKNIQTYLNSVA